MLLAVSARSQEGAAAQRLPQLQLRLEGKIPSRRLHRFGETLLWLAGLRFE